MGKRRPLSYHLNPLRWTHRRRVIFGTIITIVAVLAIYAPSILSFFYFLRLTSEVNDLPRATPIQPSDRVLVISPHPDDETLGCSAAIMQARQAGAQVKIVWLTCGDSFEWDEILLSRHPLPPTADMLNLGTNRASEARAAARVLGVSDSDLIFLGYPDEGLLRMFLDYYLRPYDSRSTGKSAVPYNFAYHPGAPYTGQSLERDLRNVVAKYKPTVVFCPAVQDRHPDHRAAAYNVLRIMGERGEIGRVRWYIVHGGIEWPIPKAYHPHLPLGVPPRGLHLQWKCVPMDDAQEQQKHIALECYKSQLRVLGPFLTSFVRTNELEAVDMSLDPLPPELEK